MVEPKKEGFGNNNKLEGSDRPDRAMGDDSSEEPREIDGFESSGRRTAGGFIARLRDVLQDESDGDLLLDRREVETGILPWLRALDLHVLGACRADERLKPLLKFNISNGVAEDMLLAQLSQHFEASEVGIIVRCLCVPLVSIRVGKVTKQGNLLCPSTTRGHLNLTLLPSSNMHVSFTGDDGCTERLAILSNNSDSSEVVIEEISDDGSGRSFLIRLLGSQVLYFWCSEKSKPHGLELLEKMKDLLRRKPTLSHLTGICESRLESLATHLRTYLLGTSDAPEADPIAPSGALQTSVNTAGSDSQSPPPFWKSSRVHSGASHASKEQPSHQDCLSPRSITFKDRAITSSSSMRTGNKEKLRWHGDDNPTLFINSQVMPSVSLCCQTTGQCEDDSIRGSDCCELLPLIPKPEMPCVSSSLLTSVPSLLNLPLPQISASKSMFSPYYCWCPPCPSSLQYSVNPHHLPLAITSDEFIPLPPLSSLFTSGCPVPPVTSNLSFDVSKLPTLDLPPLFPEPIVRLPLAASSLVTLPTSQQISTFTPFIISDPIVHTPMIDVCSSGQGYLVSAGHAISSSAPHLLPSFVNHPLIPNTESAVEKSARETLRILMASTPVSTCQKLVTTFQPFLGKMDENFLGGLGSEHGSQRLHKGAFNFQTVAMSLSPVGLSSSRDKVVDDCVKRGEPDISNSVDDLAPSSKNSEECDSAEDDVVLI